MKTGDKVEVTVAGHTVAMAEIKEINGDKAILIVPATRVEFGIESRLSDLPVENNGGGTQVIIDDVVRQSADAPAAVPNVPGQTADDAAPQAPVAPEVVTPAVEAQPAVDAAPTVDAAQVTSVESEPKE